MNSTDIEGLDTSGETRRLRSISLYKQAYGDKVRLLAEDAKSNEFVTNADLLSAENSSSMFKRAKGGKSKRTLNASREFGCWVLKVKNASLSKKKVRIFIPLFSVACVPRTLSLFKG